MCLLYTAQGISKTEEEQSQDQSKGAGGYIKGNAVLADRKKIRSFSELMLFMMHKV